MPLASLVQVPFIALLGPTAIASALPFAIAGAFAAPIAWLIGRDAGAGRHVALGAGILTAVPGLSLMYMTQPDNFSLYQPLVAGSLLLAARGLRRRPRAFALAGLLAGLATLSRNDGVLVLGALGLAFLWDRVGAWRSGGARTPRVPLAAAIGALTLFALAVTPWYLRQLATFGQLSPSTASGKVLFIRDISEWNSITIPASLDHLLGMGIGPLLMTRLGGLIAAITIFSILIGVVALVPFMVGGAWRRRRDVTFGPFFAFAFLLFAFSTLVSAVHVPGGTFIHSAVGLAPHAYVLALEGVVGFVAFLGARRSGWNVDKAAPVFTWALVGFTVLAAIGGALSVQRTWSDKRDRMDAVTATLEAQGAGPNDRLMSTDASGYRYAAGRPGVVLVNDPLETVEAVARAYGIRWLILERADGVASMVPVFEGTVDPVWLGAPVTPDGQERTRVFPVCVDAADTRCAP